MNHPRVEALAWVVVIAALGLLAVVTVSVRAFKDNSRPRCTAGVSSAVYPPVTPTVTRWYPEGCRHK